MPTPVSETSRICSLHQSSAVDRADPTYLHEQVAAEIRRALADGEAGPGKRIPGAKDLAAVLGVNTNTVLRALPVLREEGRLSGDRRAPRPARVRAATSCPDQ